MSIFKCKMCGGTLEIKNNETVATCEYCGTQQTLPKLENDRRANLYDRANHFRRNNEFDKAMGIYEQILNEDQTDAEAYWSLVLCRYGIEYVEDPVSHRRVPTVNRAQYTSIFDDDNYKSALQYADSYQHSIYEEEARAINEIQKGILAISQKEDPFDVFICYKETDSSGRRTPDSVLANDLYHQLTQEGFKVFFARITLEDKLGSAYEPYIFAALNSAKVMVVLGTKPEYFNAVWVKNEWSRYLSLIRQGQKKMLIPAYKDMDPYDLPEEFSHLQAQDMSRLGFMQDLIRGIKKIAQVEEPKTTVVKETVIAGNNAGVEPLLKRAFMYLEDEEWDSAKEYCEKVLDMDPENALAYLGELMVDCRKTKRENLKALLHPFDQNNNYQKILRFGDQKLKNELSGYLECIKERNERIRLDKIYKNAKNAMSAADTEDAYKEAAQIFESIREYMDAEELAKKCYELAEITRKNAILDSGKSKMTGEIIADYEEAIELFKSIPGWKDADERIDACRRKIEEIKVNAEIARKDDILASGKAKMNGKVIANYKDAIKLFESIPSWKDADEQIDICYKTIEQIKQEEKELKEKKEKRAKKRKQITVIVASTVCTVLVFLIVKNIVIHKQKYNEALSLMEAEQYEEAIDAFEDMGDYADSKEKIMECKYDNAISLMNAGNIIEAYEALVALEGYKDSVERADSIYNKYKKEKNEEPKVGGYMYLGTYEQDNKNNNGKEPIKWIILEIKDNKALLISKYILDAQKYNTDLINDITWETCSLRKWLNKDFLNDAFSNEEKGKIFMTTVSADTNPDYDTNPGNITQDKIFLFSITEAEKYFNSDDARQCEATEYAIANGMEHYKKQFHWWLRSPGNSQDKAATVSAAGDLSTFKDGKFIHNEHIGVRPALWVDLSAK